MANPEPGSTTGPTSPDAPMVPTTRRWLAAFAVAYGVLHHQGYVFAGLGNVGSVASGGTRWADWLDLLTPVFVLGPALGALMAARPVERRPWLIFAGGAVLYVEGHGIHLAANSIANEAEGAGSRPTPVTHLWDEPIGHHLWYGGLVLVVVALVVALHRRAEGPRLGPLPLLLALQFGVTYTTNALEGGTAILGLGTSVAFVAWGAVEVRRGRPADRPVPALVLATFGPAVLLLLGYGLIHRGFPQPSEVGWGVFG